MISIPDTFGNPSSCRNNAESGTKGGPIKNKSHSLHSSTKHAKKTVPSWSLQGFPSVHIPIWDVHRCSFLKGPCCLKIVLAPYGYPLASLCNPLADLSGLGTLWTFCIPWASLGTGESLDPLGDHLTKPGNPGITPRTIWKCVPGPFGGP